MTDKLSFLDDALAELKEQGLYNTIRTIESPQGPELRVNGRDVLNFCSNNYLGLANHPALTQAAIEAIQTYGIGPTAVRSISGTMALHLELEERLARFKGAEAVLSVQSGFTANQAVIPNLVGKEDLVVSDELNHASIIDGVRLTHAARAIYKHNDVDSLAEVLADADSKGYRRVLVITDGVFSMDGDVAPLPAIVEVCERHHALLMVDDAHGEGVLGKGGRGIVDHFGLHGRVDVEVGTLSKAFGVVGGILAGEGRLVDYLRQRARPFLFSSAMTVPDVAACLAAVRLLEDSEALVERLWANTAQFKEAMRAEGFDLGKSETPITPVMLGEAKLAQDFSRQLFERGIFAQAITFPTVPRGLARIRVMLSAAHEPAHLERAVEAFREVGRGLGVVG